MKRLIILLLTLSLLIGGDGVNDFKNDAGTTIANGDRIHFLDISKIGTTGAMGKEYVTYFNLYTALNTTLAIDSIETRLTTDRDSIKTLEDNKYESGDIIVGASFTGASGATVTEFSTDTTFSGNSDLAVPTEKAVKTYIDLSSVAVVSDTVQNTTVETVIWTGVTPANSISAGSIILVKADGVVTNGGASGDDQVTLRVKVNGATKVTLTPLTKAMTDAHWHIDANATQRTIGASGSRAMHFDLDIDGITGEMIGVGTINTTLGMDITITIQWASADASNVFVLNQAFLEIRNR